LYDPAPLRILRAAKFKDLFGNQQPDDPKREAELLEEVARAAVRGLEAKRGVVVYCQGGPGRTGL